MVSKFRWPPVDGLTYTDGLGRARHVVAGSTPSQSSLAALGALSELSAFASDSDLEVAPKRRRPRTPSPPPRETLPFGADGESMFVDLAALALSND